VTNNNKYTCATFKLKKRRIITKDACVCFVWYNKIEQQWFGYVSLPISFVLNHVFDSVCTNFIGTKQISNIKHLMTFNIKREVVHVDIIVLALRLTIKSQIHAIHMTKGGNTMLHFV
jgi:hypothetical protein